MSNLQQVLDDRSRELTPLVLRIFIFVYVLFTGSHYLLLPPVTGILMSTISGASVLFAFVIQLNLKNSLIQQNAERVLLSLVLVMGINSVAHLHFSREIEQTTNFIFVLATAGYILPTSRYFYSFLAGLLLSWVLLVTLGFESPEVEIHYGFEMAMAAMFSVVLHTLVRRQLMQLSELEDVIDQLNKSQRQSATSQSLLQNLMDKIPAGIIVRDDALRILFINQSGREIIGFGEEDVLGLKPGEDKMILVGPDGEVLAEDQWPPVRVAETSEPIVNEVMGSKHSDGTISWGLVNVFPMVLDEASGQVLVSTFVDITERIEIEIQLRDSEERAHAVIDAVHEGIVTVDINDRVTLINPAAQAMTGFSESEALGQPLSNIVHFAEDDWALYTRVEGNAAPVSRGTMTVSNGDTIDVELIVSRISSAGKKLGEVLTFRDLRDQLRSEQERATMDKMRSVGVLAGGIAHDFNNLLMAIYGNLSLATSSLDNPDRARTFIKRSTDSIELATNLTNQLLTFATGSDPVRDVVDVEKLVRDATQFALSGSNIAVKFTIDADICAVEVDAGQMQQAISNIVLNAKQAMQEGGLISIEIHNRFAESGGAGFVEVVIRDSGQGIAPDSLQKIFDPYFTTKETGIGLGLATTHSIVTKHGGSVSVDSTPGIGTSFSLLLPMAQTELVEPAVPSAEHPAAGCLNVLMMDDEDLVRETVCSLLETLGHRVTAVIDGEQAIAAYRGSMERNNKFDLVIMDLTIPGGMGGKEAAEKVLEIDPDARLIVSSGYSAGAEMARYQEFGFRARLEKPFLLRNLEEALEEAMQ